MPRTLKDSGIPWVGQIPADWDMHPLYYYFGERNRPNRLGKNNNLLSLSYGKIIKKDINTNEGLLPASYNSYNIIEPLDIVLRLTDLQNDKRSLRTGLSFERGIITSAYVTLKPVKQVSSVFFHYLLHAYDVSKVLYNMGNGVRQSLNYDELSKLPLIEPPLAEQKKIADFLDKKCGEVDALAHNIQQQIDTLEQYKRAIITETVTKGLNPSAPMKDSGIPWIGQIPKHWEIIRFKNLGMARNGLTYTPRDTVDAGGVLVLRASNIQNNALNLQDIVYVNKYIPHRLMLKSNDILICSRNGSAKLIGKNALIPKGLTASFGAFMMVYRCRFPHYLRFILNSDVFMYNLSSFLTSTVNQLTTDNFLNIRFAYTQDLNEQKNIVLYLDDKCGKIDALIKTKQEQLAKLEEYKKAIIFECVTGKKPVPEEER